MPSHFDEMERETVWTGVNSYLVDGNDISSFNFTPTAVLIATISGSLSCVSSLVIISIITRSKTQSPYHRIILFYSIFDFMFSLAIALTTIPMPKTVKDENMIYEFGGPSYGNELTCTMQGFIILLCLGFLMFSASLLYIYFCCSIVFKMPKETFALKVERPFVICCLVVLVTYSLITLLRYGDMFNPSPLAPWCSWDSYPHGCKDDDDSELNCIRGKGKDQNVLILMMMPLLLGSFLTLLVTMTLILRSYSKNMKSLHKDREESHLHNEEEEALHFSIAKEAATNSKKITLQAMAYITSFLLTWIPLLLRFGIKDSDVVEILRLVFQPCQGFFHVVIFLWDKVDLVRINSPNLDLSTLQILKMVVLRPSEIEDDRPISNLFDVIQTPSNELKNSISNLFDGMLTRRPKTELKNSSDFGFRIYTDIKIPQVNIPATQEYDTFERSSQEQGESIDSLFLSTKLSLASIPEDGDFPSGNNDNCTSLENIEEDEIYQEKDEESSKPTADVNSNTLKTGVESIF
ncbi:hypothetical protein CTEN210_12722 [Chaetoceros tenuissimus]|uniref:G-protein coupled receptors family 1 profile domain-containing protein n=1 Tax=Chaetoceros tenuissimus TaxID=426638 RepID=A0AAD3D1R4_9STRA|nr:hypothetical protein CTEN210_12722 [Chaetoceros tenuissimus]